MDSPLVIVTPNILILLTRVSPASGWGVTKAFFFLLSTKTISCDFTKFRRRLLDLAQFVMLLNSVDLVSALEAGTIR